MVFSFEKKRICMLSKYTDELIRTLIMVAIMHSIFFSGIIIVIHLIYAVFSRTIPKLLIIFSQRLFLLSGKSETNSR